MLHGHVVACSCINTRCRGCASGTLGPCLEQKDHGVQVSGSRIQRSALDPQHCNWFRVSGLQARQCFRLPSLLAAAGRAQQQQHVGHNRHNVDLPCCRLACHNSLHGRD